MDGKLTRDEARSPVGCGGGGPQACYALTRSTKQPGQYLCSLVAAPPIARARGVRLNWQTNKDPEDGRSWCPLGRLENSKTCPNL